MVDPGGAPPEHRPALGGCWLWTGARTANGYGTMSAGGRYGATLLAHRLAYEWYRGAIPDGLQIDHLCRVRHCVNPWHLEAVTQEVNLKRGMAPGMVIWRRRHGIAE